MMKYQAILFDLDGTLVNNYPNYIRLMEITAKQLHLFINNQILRETFPTPINQALDYLGVYQSKRSNFEDQYFINQVRLKLKPILFPGVNEVFQQLEKTLWPALGIVTSGGKNEIEALKRNYQFTQKLWTIVTGEATLNHKPAPDPLLKALDQIGVQSSKALYIGDDLSDECAANNAKMDFGIAGWSSDPKIHFQTAKYSFQRPQDILLL